METFWARRDDLALLECNPEGIAIIQPGVARNELRWVGVLQIHQP